VALIETRPIRRWSRKLGCIVTETVEVEQVQARERVPEEALQALKEKFERKNRG